MQTITLDSINSEEVYHYKARHGAHKYRDNKLGLADSWNYDDKEKRTAQLEYLDDDGE